MTHNSKLSMWSYIDFSLKMCLASMDKLAFSFLNSELISISVLVEEVLIECEETIGMRRQAADRGAQKFLKLIGKKSNKAEKVNIKSILSKILSDTRGEAAGKGIKIFSPVEATEFAVSYLNLHLQLIPLRARWGCRKMKVSNIYNDEE